MRILLPAALAALTLGAAATAQSPLQTILVSNNSGSPGGAVYFDLIGGNTGLAVNAFDINYSAAAGLAVGLDVYLRGGTHVGFESSTTGWSLVAQDNGAAVTAGRDLATNVVLANTFCVPAGATIGVALVASAASGFAYTNGTGTNQVYTNADLTLSAGAASNVPFTGAPFTPRIFNGAVYYNMAPGCNIVFPSGLDAVGEATLNSGTLSAASPQEFEDNWFLRWNLVDTSGTTAGNPGVVVGNIGWGGSPAVGTTPGISGFIQLSAASTPTGNAFSLPPGVVGGPTGHSFPVPAGILSPGDTLRVQGLTLDVGTGTVLPTNSIELVHRDPVNILIRCDGSNSFNSNTAFGYFSVDHLASSTLAPIASIQFDWVTSSNPGQATMEFDTDQTGMADLFEGGNGGMTGCLGTYRNGGDVATGLVYDAANTIPASPCDPTALTGWTGTNPGNAVDDWRTLDFRFTTFVPGTKFEFDSDTDGGAGITGDSMAGMVVTSTLR